MTTGIYALYWAEPDLIYIGQSKNLDIRKYEHFRLMKNGIHTKKIQGVYDNYAYPEFIILEVTLDLDVQEVCWITEVDALNPEVGVNTTSGGQSVGKDTTHASSKFTKQQILEACKLLVDYTIPQKVVSATTGISQAVISTILNDTRHTWIAIEYPEIRKALDNSRALRYEYNLPNSKYKNYCLVSPTGIRYNNILNISSFAKEHNLLGTKLNEVLKRKRTHHLGWTVAK